VGCEVQIEYGVGDWRSKEKVYRTKPTDSLDICAKAFFGYDLLNDSRLRKPQLFGKEETFGNTAQILATYLKGEGTTAIVISGYLSNENLALLKEIAQRSSALVSTTLTVNLYPFLQTYGEYKPIGIKDLKNYSQFLLVGEDLTSTAPVLSYYIKGKVFKVGNVQRDAKLNPEVISWEDAQKLDGKGLLIFNLEGIFGESAKEWGAKVRKFKEEKGWDVMLVCKEANFLGVLENFSWEELTPIEGLIRHVEEGRVRNLLIFGEDLLDLYGSERISKLREKVEHFVVFSPFLDGLSSLSYFRVPMFLMGEEEGTYSTLMGKRKTKGFLPGCGSLQEFLKSILDSLPKGGNISRLSEELFPQEGLVEVHLYRSNWLTRRSANLSKLYEKNSLYEGVKNV
jgi:NADH-quinone oxidoreductase subunit G